MGCSGARCERPDEVELHKLELREVEEEAEVVLAAVVVNTLVKAGMATVLGSKALGRAVAITLVPAAILGIVAWILI